MYVEGGGGKRPGLLCPGFECTCPKLYLGPVHGLAWGLRRLLVMSALPVSLFRVFRAFGDVWVCTVLYCTGIRRIGASWEGAGEGRALYPSSGS